MRPMLYCLRIVLGLVLVDIAGCTCAGSGAVSAPEATPIPVSSYDFVADASLRPFSQIHLEAFAKAGFPNGAGWIPSELSSASDPFRNQIADDECVARGASRTSWSEDSYLRRVPVCMGPALIIDKDRDGQPVDVRPSEVVDNDKAKKAAVAAASAACSSLGLELLAWTQPKRNLSTRMRQNSELSSDQPRGRLG